MNFSQFFVPCTALRILLWRNWRKGLLVRSKSIVFGCYWNCSSLIFFFFQFSSCFWSLWASSGHFWPFSRHISIGHGRVFVLNLIWHLKYVVGSQKNNFLSQISCKYKKNTINGKFALFWGILQPWRGPFGLVLSTGLMLRFKFMI